MSYLTVSFHDEGVKLVHAWLTVRVGTASCASWAKVHLAPISNFQVVYAQGTPTQNHFKKDDKGVLLMADKTFLTDHNKLDSLHHEVTVHALKVWWQNQSTTLVDMDVEHHFSSREQELDFRVVRVVAVNVDHSCSVSYDLVGF